MRGMRGAHTKTGKPIPFFITILPVIFYLALIGLGYYVYVVTVCVWLFREDKVALGVVLLVLYHLTFFMMLWAYAMVILTDPGRVPPEHHQPESQQQLQVTSLQQDHNQEGPLGLALQRQHSLHYPIESPQPYGKDASSSSPRPRGVLIPGAQGGQRGGYIYITEDASPIAGHPLWCYHCEHVKPERAHHCRVCRRCVMKMDHHCPWVLNCVGQENYKFFVLFISYTALHCIYILVSSIPLYVQFYNISRTHHVQIVGIVLAGIFGLTLVVFAITHIRLILLNRTTIEDQSTPYHEGVLPCFRGGWGASEGEINQGNERLYDVGLKDNWQQSMGRGWQCLLPIRFSQGEAPMHNKKVVARQLKDYHEQEETRLQQQQHPHPHQANAVAIGDVEQLRPLEQEVYQGITDPAARLEDHDSSSSAESSTASRS